MDRNEWKNWYRESLREWSDEYKNALREWRERFRDWKKQAKSSIFKGVPPPMPPKPPIPPVPSMPPISGGRSNVVASRIGDEELKMIDVLIEAGLFSTRSEAVAYLVGEGVKARQDILGKVSSALEEIRKIKKEAEEEVAKLKREIGLADLEETGKSEKKIETCPNCIKDLSDLPEDIAVCPYCGTDLGKN